MKTIGVILYITIVLTLLLAWPVNAYLLSKCDFEAPYKCEVVHAIGLIPPAQLVTVWFGTDK